jgi:hypothetical protein
VVNNPSGSTSVRVRDADRPTSEELIARARISFGMVVIAGIFVCCVGLGIFALMTVPLAHVIAGKHTDFTFTFTLSLSATLAVSTALAGGGLVVQTKRARRYKNRTKELETRLEDLSKNQPEDAGQNNK